ncbi:fungal-specific transcription factor domain-containing protein [Talaromyces proteolyticus]|uniref:Fungal-specific transcription factor domain-containing protein n=1 Tax=Talaromyces proteolyticus TaxID=1131652 RepID=A0AAD4KNB6_9EURO|nr:fungal-specific transcription factor domain-containing protein [Talaromyces proteolyticus]KAH8693055.1 fungal-specific transcription factor domain-containing protein [Talaromyces proteolyticus]
MQKNRDVRLRRAPHGKSIKSFNGCWTCRRRSVRCDEHKPQCFRCMNTNRECEGFEIRLTWLTITPEKLCQRQAASHWGSRDLFSRRDNDSDDSNPSRSKRRHIPALTVFNMDLPSYNEIELDTILHEVQLNSEQLNNQGCPLQHGPFGVFRLKPESPSIAAHPHSISSALSEIGAAVPAASRIYDSDHPQFRDEVISPAECVTADDVGVFHDALSHRNLNYLSPLSNSSTGPAGTDYLAPDQTIIPWGPASVVSTEEPDINSPLKLRELFHHWRRYLVRLMIPFATENPYITIITPMVESMDLDRMGPANSAVFWSIMTASAFSKARMVQDGHEYIKLGESYYAKTLNFLSICFSNQDVHQGLTVLAALTMSTLIDVFRPLPNSRENWQLHLQAGRLWIKSRDLEIPSQDPNASILIELILLLEVLGFSGKRPLTPSLREPFLSLKYCTIDRFRLRVPVLHDSYHLERMFGLPLNVFESIIWTNLLVQKSAGASQEEIEALGFQITSANPAFFHHPPSDAPDAYARNCIRNLFYHACEIYFERQVLHTPVTDVQWIVTAAFPYIQGLLSHDHELQGPCLSWPIFIIAAEAIDPEVCKTAIAFFDLDWPRRIGNYSAAKQVLLEVERRRKDLNSVDVALHWTRVMDEMGLDILLV